MFGLINTAIRFFIIGLATGVLIAPRPGPDTRRMIRHHLESIVNEVLGIAGLPPIQTGAGAGGGERRRGRGRQAQDPSAASSAT